MQNQQGKIHSLASNQTLPGVRLSRKNTTHNVENGKPKLIKK